VSGGVVSRDAGRAPEELSGEALVEDLRRRFVITTERVSVGGAEFEVMHPRSADELISDEDFERDERLPYWAQVWPAALVLADVLAREPSPAPGATLLELGCGVGVVALAAMRAGYEVTVTDYYADALRFARANAWRAFGVEPDARLVDWRALPTDLGMYDRVVASDVLYERPYAALVATAVRLALAPGGEALVADPGRIAAPDFVRESEARGLRVREEITQQLEAASYRQHVTVYALRRPRLG
jgi:predicted nicotinamide N-methyase